jgi:hypothetical protein
LGFVFFDQFAPRVCMEVDVPTEFRLLMISAMYENGGNTTQRLLDGHPELFSYPFESQPGTKYVQDHLTSLFPVKYRWPVFPLSGSAEADYDAIIDEECKVRLKTPHASKFREFKLEMDDWNRKSLFLKYMAGQERSRANIMSAFFRASADAWKDCQRSGREKVHVGYSPIIVMDADKIVQDWPNAHVLHVVRNPWSAYADTKKRPVPQSLAQYIAGWCIVQQAAMTFSEMFPDRVHILRYEDIVAYPVTVLNSALSKLGVSKSPTVAKPTWNGRMLSQVHPWGTVRSPTPEANRATAEELTDADKDEIRIRARPYLEHFDYENYLSLTGERDAA